MGIQLAPVQCRDRRSLQKDHTRFIHRRAACQLLASRPLNVVPGALANKMARTGSALPAHDRLYQQNYGAHAA